MDLFDSLADKYDTLRGENLPYISKLLGLIRRFDSKFVLDIGCGTGKVAEKILQEADVELIGVDISQKMLAKFSTKSTGAKLICASGEALPFGDGVADGIMCIYLLHLLRDPQKALREFRRVLKKGWILIVSAPHHFIRLHPLNKFFPSFMKIDLARFPLDEDIISFLKEAGFSSIEVQYCSVFRKWYSQEYLERVKSRFISTLRLLPEEEFLMGVKQMEEFLQRGEEFHSLPWESIVVIGYV